MTTERKANGKPFVHHHAAHCESGVASALLRDKGMDISEPMVFGIGSGIFFGYLPFMKMTGLPITTFRAAPGSIFRKTAKRLGADFVTKKFRNPQKGMDELKQVLKTWQLVGLIRWVEEVGTGGGGFRYMYAAFLQEAAQLFGSGELADLSKEMNAIGDSWRAFSVTAARIVKQRNKEEETFAKAGGLMLICAGREENFFKNLNKVVRKLKA